MSNSYISPLPTPYFLGEIGEENLVNGYCKVIFKLIRINSNYHISISSDSNEIFRWKNRTIDGFEIFSSSSKSSANVHWQVHDKMPE